VRQSAAFESARDFWCCNDIEPMAFRKPVITTAFAGPDSIVTEESGILVPPRDIERFVEAMNAMMERIGKYDGSRIRNHCLERFGEKAFAQKLTAI